MPSRRQVLISGAAGMLVGLAPGLSAAALPGEARLVVVLLRGGMDGLHAVPPVGDPAYARARGAMALEREMVLPLDNTYAFHPALAPLLPYWRKGELAVVHAVASPYRARSHFDGQDLLESGGARPHQKNDGWLNRALTALSAGRNTGLAVANGLPLILQGAAPASSWAPSPLPGLPPELIAKVKRLYAADLQLAAAFEEGVQASAMAEEAMSDPADSMTAEPPRKGRDFRTMAQAAGRLLAAPEGPRVAVLELGGWDTHVGQGLATGRMAETLGKLAAGLDALAQALGPAWRNTIVVTLTEFGRTVAANGTNGTDHGTASLSLLLGGKVAGGRVLTDWPGLSPAALHEGRDLKPTTDVRAVLKGVLADHLGASKAALDSAVFPDSGAVAAMRGMVRGV